MNNQKFKWIPSGGYGIDWRGSGGYALTIEKATAAAVKFLQGQEGRDTRMKATACIISHRKPGTEGSSSVWRDVAKALPNGTSTEIERCFNPLVRDARLSLVESVAQTVFDNTESFNDRNVGTDLAYLIMAIVSEKDWAEVDWTVEGYGGECELLRLLEETFPQYNPVWLYIQKD